MKLKDNKKGIILAAGLGPRLFNPERKDTVKPLITIGELALLLRVIHNLEMAFCDKVIIVLGWKADIIEEYVLSHYDGPLELRFVFNPNYHLQNGISVLCAQPYVGNEFILTMADHILDDDIMRLIRNHHPPPGGATLFVDYKIDSIFDINDATKVLTEGRLVKCIGKKLDAFNCIDTGVFVGTNGLMEAISQVYKRKGDASLSEGVQVLADSDKMEVLDIKNSFWQDVDTPEMLLHAEKLLHLFKERD